MSTVTFESRSLQVHKNLLIDVIKRQAGTPDKAVLEAVMNSIEAGASKVSIKTTVDENDKLILEIFDDGKGISTKEDLIKYFETFGTPHNESEHKIWAEFRMGRGQMFAFGKNTWETSCFRMIVDIDNKGMTYDLYEIPFTEGCYIKIEFYRNPIGGYLFPTIDSFKRAIKSQIEFMDVDIFFNCEQLNQSPVNLNWSYQDDNAYYMFLKGAPCLKIYNKGAFVKDLGVNIQGFGGVIVSKKIMKMNFARNDIISDCPVFEKIQETIQNHRKEIAKNSVNKSKNLSKSERMAILQDLINGNFDYWEDVQNVKIFQLTNGKYMSFDDILKVNRWTLTSKNDLRADKAMQLGIAVVLDDDILNQIDCSDRQELFHCIMKNSFYKVPQDETVENILGLESRYIPYSSSSSNSLENLISSDIIILETESLPPVYKNLIKAVDYTVGSYLNSIFGNRNFSLYLGKSEVSDAWTDGETFVALNIDLFRKNSFSYEAVANLISIIIHESCHVGEKTEISHGHDRDFYQRFHDDIVSGSCLFSKVEYLRNRLNRAVSNGKYEKMIEAEDKKKEKIRKKEERMKKKMGIRA